MVKRVIEHYCASKKHITHVQKSKLYNFWDGSYILPVVAFTKKPTQIPPFPL